jgi:hypothetical protein
MKKLKEIKLPIAFDCPECGATLPFSEINLPCAECGALPPEKFKD